MNRKLRQLTIRMLTVLALLLCASTVWSLTTDAASPTNFVASYDYEEIAHADSTWEREVPVAVTAFAYDDAIVQAPKVVHESDASPAAPNASLHRILHLFPRPPPTDASTTISRFLNAPRTGAQVAEGKFDYLFGKAQGSKNAAHNLPRTNQNALQMKRLGVFDDAQGRGLLQSHFDDVVHSNSNITRTFTDKYGTFEIRESLFPGPSGKFAKFESR